MQTTVITEDRTIYHDGVALVVEDAPFDPAIHAIQWDGEAGVIEFADGRNVATTDPAIIAPFVAAFATEQVRLAEADTAADPDPWEAIRAERDARIAAIRWRIERHHDEVALDTTPSEPLEPLLLYVQALRDVPQTFDDPDAIDWPDTPPETE